ncbi:MAG: PD-(D/E)XK nuclease family protein [Candidatus Daviesbacteria bacterium]|nr:PD-(D/E)XK nuclease family protein [Candidatus Daviesbacteria bacterium]
MIPKQEYKFIKDALWVSYTALKDFLKCPNAYYLKNIYKDPKTGFRLQIASPYLSLGSVVHDSARWLLDLQGQVTKDQLEQKFRNLWLKYRGKRGGFSSKKEEGDFGRRGLEMIGNFYKNWKVLGKAAPQVAFPKYQLTDNVILIGNFDFVEERPDGSLHIVDFKTGATDEDDSLQLYIYAILAEANFGKPVTRASFWYLDREDTPREIVLDPLEPKLDWLKGKVLELKKAIEKGNWVCIKKELCRDCRDYQAIINGKGEFQFSDFRYKKDIYYLPKINHS